MGRRSGSESPSSPPPAEASPQPPDEDRPSRLRRRAQLLRELDRAKTLRARLSPVGDPGTRLRRPLRHV